MHLLALLGPLRELLGPLVRLRRQRQLLVRLLKRRQQKLAKPAGQADLITKKVWLQLLVSLA